MFANASRNYAKTDAYIDPVTGLLVPRTIIGKAPQSTAAGGILYKHGPIRFSVTDKWTGPQYADLANTQRIDPYNTVNLAASYQIGPVVLGIDVTDLLELAEDQPDFGRRADQGHGSDDQPGHVQVYYQPGRAITGQVRFKF